MTRPISLLLSALLAYIPASYLYFLAIHLFRMNAIFDSVYDFDWVHLAIAPLWSFFYLAMHTLLFITANPSKFIIAFPLALAIYLPMCLLTHKILTSYLRRPRNIPPIR